MPDDYTVTVNADLSELNSGLEQVKSSASVNLQPFGRNHADNQQPPARYPFQPNGDKRLYCRCAI